MILERAAPSSSSAVSSPRAHVEALRSLLSSPSLPDTLPRGGGLASSTSTSRVQLGPNPSLVRGEGGPSAGALGLGRKGSGTGGGGGVTYRAFMERLMRPESKGFVKAIRLFLISILGDGGDCNPVSSRARAAAGHAGRQGAEDIEVYGSSFLVER